MAKDSPSPPQAPDPEKTAAAQFGLNEDTARLQAQLNRYNVNTPYYTQTWQQSPGSGAGAPQYDYDAYNKALTDYSTRLQGSQGQLDPNWTGQGSQWIGGSDPGQAPNLEQYRNADSDNPQSDQWTTNYNLTPAGQEIFDQQQQIQKQLSGIAGTAADRVQNTLSQPFSPSGLPDFRYGTGAGPIQQQIDQRYINDGSQATEALLSRLNPSLERDREALINRTINTGHLQGSQGYNEALDAFGRQANDARMQAVLAAPQYSGAMQNIGAQQAGFANAAQGQMFSQGLANAQFSNQARNQNLQEQVYQRNLPLNETTALLSGSQVQMPNIQPTQGIGVSPVDYSSLANNQYLGQLGQYNADVAGNNAMTSGLFSLAGTVGGSMLGGPVGASIGGGLGSALNPLNAPANYGGNSWWGRQ